MRLARTRPRLQISYHLSSQVRPLSTRRQLSHQIAFSSCKERGIRYFIPLVAGFWLTACAALFSTKEKVFDLRSDPDSADIYLAGGRLGTTPAKIKLSNLKEYNFVFKKLGFKETSCTLSKGTDFGWIIGNVFSWGLVGIIVDAATGSWSQTRGKGCTAQFEALPAPLMAIPAEAPAPQVADASRTTDQASTPAPLPTAVPAAAPASPPVVGYTQLPTGTNYVGDNRIKRYYPLGCAAQHSIPPDHQVFFQTASGAVQDGFVPSGDC